MINPIKSVVAIFMKHDSLDYLINKPTYSLFSWGEMVLSPCLWIIVSEYDNDDILNSLLVLIVRVLPLLRCCHLTMSC